MYDNEKARNINYQQVAQQGIAPTNPAEILSPVNRNVQTLDKELAQLEETLALLGQKILAILSPEYPQPNDPCEKPKEAPQSPFVCMLNETTRRVVALRIMAGQLIERVEL